MNTEYPQGSMKQHFLHPMAKEINISAQRTIVYLHEFKILVTRFGSEFGRQKVARFGLFHITETSRNPVNISHCYLVIMI